MTKMKTTSELCKEVNASRLFSKDKELYALTSLGMIEAFRLAVEADFVSRCVLSAHKHEDNERKRNEINRRGFVG